jgi:hypothetical protein
MSADDSVDAANVPPSTDAIPSVESDESTNGSGMLDPTTASREYMRIGGDLYEIWKPGDKDGNEFTDWYGRTPKVPVEQRWRIFQVSSHQTLLLIVLSGCSASLAIALVSIAPT